MSQEDKIKGVMLVLLAINCCPGQSCIDSNGMVDSWSRVAVRCFWAFVRDEVLRPEQIDLLIFSLMVGDFVDDLVMDGVAGKKTREALNIFLALGDQAPVLE